MQVQKTEIKNKIIKAAMALFAENGYNGSSMRGIAHLAGITPGNIYAYFENKNEILSCILDECVENIQNYITHIYENEIYSSYLIKNVSETLTNIVSTHKDEFVILFGNMQGSKYENIKSDIIKAVSKRIHNALTLHSDYTHDMVLSEAIATAYVEGIIKIILNTKDDVQKMKSMVEDFTQIIFTVNFPKKELTQ